jgi:RND family efflux transporter MFP subunit
MVDGLKKMTPWPRNRKDSQFMPENTHLQFRETTTMPVDETKVAEEKAAAGSATAAGSRERSSKATLPHSVLLFLVAAAVAILLVTAFGIHSRVVAATRLARATNLAAVPSVIVVHPQPSLRSQELVLPGNTQAFIDSPIYARTNGYLKRWYVDIGTRVRQGQLLAEIETPELDEQLRQARAELATAQANLNLSEITAKRNQNLLKTHSVSSQERDNAVNANAANKATVESNEANVARLEQLQSFEKVYAPFDGVITARSTDVGALIDAGANAPKELFHIAAINKLRVYVAVPEVYSRAAVSGAGAELTLDEYPGQMIHGTLVRNSNAIDPAARTLLVEVDVDNRLGRLIPGAYVQVHLRVPADARSLTVPSSALIFRRGGLQVAVVRDSTAQLVRIAPGRDYGDSMEILAGLAPTDEVILSPSDSLTSGTPVEIASSKGNGDGQ